jgi:hypothetical protein
VPTSNVKDPNARLDYVWDWKSPPAGQDRGWLEDGETITEHTVTVESGDVEIDGTPQEVDGVVTAWLQGGTTRSVVTCHIVTSEGREDDRSRTITIRER